MIIENMRLIVAHKIQITVDEELNNTIKARAKKIGLSVSSYARLALVNAINYSVLDQALEDIKSHNVEALTLAEFQRQIDEL